MGETRLINSSHFLQWHCILGQNRCFRPKGFFPCQVQWLVGWGGVQPPSLHLQGGGRPSFPHTALSLWLLACPRKPSPTDLPFCLNFLRVSRSFSCDRQTPQPVGRWGRGHPGGRGRRRAGCCCRGAWTTPLLKVGPPPPGGRSATVWPGLLPGRRHRGPVPVPPRRRDPGGRLPPPALLLYRPQGVPRPARCLSPPCADVWKLAPIHFLMS